MLLRDIVMLTNRPGIVRVQSHMVAFLTQDPNVLSFAARALKQMITMKLSPGMHA